VAEPASQSSRAPRWRRVAWALLAVKLVYLAGIGAVVWWRPDFDADRAARIERTWFPAGWPPEARGKLARHFATWDAEHYLYLSAAGYQPEGVIKSRGCC